jgi:hypothetical protein
VTFTYHTERKKTMKKGRDEALYVRYRGDKGRGEEPNLGQYMYRPWSYFSSYRAPPPPMLPPSAENQIKNSSAPKYSSDLSPTSLHQRTSQSPINLLLLPIYFPSGLTVWAVQTFTVSWTPHLPPEICIWIPYLYVKYYLVPVARFYI